MPNLFNNPAVKSILNLTANVSAASGALSLVAQGVALVNSFVSAPGLSNIVMGQNTIPVSLLFQPWQIISKSLVQGAGWGHSPTPDIITQDRVSLKAQITDHFIEDNSSIQDHIAIEPVRYTMTGVVCELVFQNTQTEQLVRSYIQRLTSLGLLTPAQDATAVQYLALYDQLQSAALSAVENASLIAGGIPAADALIGGASGSKQQIAYKFLQELFQGRALMTVDTPWSSFDSMAIESLDVEQDETTSTQSVFNITFKQMRFTAGPSTSTFMSPKFAAQSATPNTLGKVSGTASSNQSLLSSLLNVGA